MHHIASTRRGGPQLDSTPQLRKIGVTTRKGCLSARRIENNKPQMPLVERQSNHLSLIGAPKQCVPCSELDKRGMSKPAQLLPWRDEHSLTPSAYEFKHTDSLQYNDLEFNCQSKRNYSCLAFVSDAVVQKQYNCKQANAHLISIGNTMQTTRWIENVAVACRNNNGSQHLRPKALQASSSGRGWR